MKVSRTQAILVAVVGVVFLALSIGMAATGAGTYSYVIMGLSVVFLAIGTIAAIRAGRS